MDINEVCTVEEEKEEKKTDKKKRKKNYLAILAIETIVLCIISNVVCVAFSIFSTIYLGFGFIIPEIYVMLGLTIAAIIFTAFAVCYTAKKHRMDHLRKKDPENIMYEETSYEKHEDEFQPVKILIPTVAVIAICAIAAPCLYPCYCAYQKSEMDIYEACDALAASLAEGAYREPRVKIFDPDSNRYSGQVFAAYEDETGCSYHVYVDVNVFGEISEITYSIDSCADLSDEENLERAQNLLAELNQKIRKSEVKGFNDDITEVDFISKEFAEEYLSDTSQNEDNLYTRYTFDGGLEVDWDYFKNIGDPNFWVHTYQSTSGKLPDFLEFPMTDGGEFTKDLAY